MAFGLVEFVVTSGREMLEGIFFKYHAYYSSVRPTPFAFRATKGKWKEWVLLSKQKQ